MRSAVFRILAVSLALALSFTAYAQTVARGPYLQQITDNTVIVRWRTSQATESVVRFRAEGEFLDYEAAAEGTGTEHTVKLTGLTPATRYFYSVGNVAGALAGDDSFHFRTAPEPGTAMPTRIWVIGDSGTADDNARAVRDAFKTWSGSTPADMMIMLGDNAYTDGTDAQYQAAVFDTYPELLRQLPLWPTLGNHDGYTANSDAQSGPYYDIFDLPTAGESGGLPSGTEAYYSFDYGNIHFVCLDSYETDRDPGGNMMQWLESDLAANDKPWVIAFWHHPPYSKGSHDSDQESRLIDMREVALPILEAWGVDLVLSGHSHSYERSYLLDGHYGLSTTLDADFNVLNPGDGRDGIDGGDGVYQKPGIVAAEHKGAVYAVAGSSGKVQSVKELHPAMHVGLASLGSMVLDFDGDRLDVVFLDQTGGVRDEFSLVKLNDFQPPQVQSVTAMDANHIQVVYSERVDALTATQIGNYTISDLTVSGAVMAEGNRSVTLDTSAMTAGKSYTLTISGVADEAGNLIAAGTQVEFALAHFARSESTEAGTVSGDYLSTHGDDGNLETLTERESGGRKSNRYSYLQHTWRFDLPPSDLATLRVKAWAGASLDDDVFTLFWSLDGAAYQPLLVIDGSDWQEADIPGSVDGTLYVQVRDSNQAPGSSSLDSLYVDQMYIHALSTGGATPPTEPSGLQAAALGPDGVELTWLDGSSNEDGFRIQRSEDGISFSDVGATGPDETSFTDTDLVVGLEYSYRVYAFNSAGDSEFSNTATVIIAEGISLSLNGYKERGSHVVEVGWSGAAAGAVQVLRDGRQVATTSINPYPDRTGNKGGATYWYQVCDTSGRCSAEVPISF